MVPLKKLASYVFGSYRVKNQGKSGLKKTIKFFQFDTFIRDKVSIIFFFQCNHTNCISLSDLLALEKIHKIKNNICFL